MAKIECFVVGASAGGLEALRMMAARLPHDFPSIVCVVVHIAADSPGLIPQILTDSGSLPCRHAVDGERPERGVIYVAPPDYHVLFAADGYFHLTRGPKENGFRPAIDPLFRSAALAFDDRCAGVILSGGLDDGVAGLVSIKNCGGGAIVQDPDDAAAPSMPMAALFAVKADRLVPAAGLAEAMTDLAHGYEPTPARERDLVKDDLEKEVRYAAGGETHLTELTRLGEPTLLTCPDCHGALIRVRAGPPVRFRCHTGHAYTLQALKARVEERVDDSLWNAIRSLEEHAVLCEHLADHLSADDMGERRDALLGDAAIIRERSAVLRRAVVSQTA